MEEEAFSGYSRLSGGGGCCFRSRRAYGERPGGTFWRVVSMTWWKQRERRHNHGLREAGYVRLVGFVPVWRQDAAHWRPHRLLLRLQPTKDYPAASRWRARLRLWRARGNPAARRWRALYPCSGSLAPFLYGTLHCVAGHAPPGPLPLGVVTR